MGVERKWRVEVKFGGLGGCRGEGGCADLRG